MYTWISKYKKDGATFNSGLEAYQDKNSLYPPELTASLQHFLEVAIGQGWLEGMPTYEWDQDTHTLSVVRLTQDPDQLLNFVISQGTWNDPAFVQASEAAGWTSLGVSEFKPV